MYCVYLVVFQKVVVDGRCQWKFGGYFPEEKDDGSFGFDLEEALELCREENNHPQCFEGKANAYVAPMPAGGVVNP